MQLKLKCIMPLMKFKWYIFHWIAHRFPGIYSWIKWCYQHPSNFQPGPLAFKCSRRIQQHDLLRGLYYFNYFWWTWCSPLQFITFQLWYLDGGTLMMVLLSDLDLLLQKHCTYCWHMHGSFIWSHPQPEKMGGFWPCGNSFSTLVEVCRPLQSRGEVGFLILEVISFFWKLHNFSF